MTPKAQAARDVARGSAFVKAWICPKDCGQ